MAEARRHILFDCEKLRNPNTGVFYYSLFLGEALLKEVNPAREVIYFYTPSSYPEPFGNKAAYFRQRSWHKLLIPGSGKMDVWHGAYQLSNYLPGSGTKLVLTIHDLNFLFDTPDASKANKMRRKMQSRIDRADCIVCISAFTRKSLLENLKIGDTRVEVIHNGAYVREFPEFDQPVYRPTKPFIFTIGSYFQKKNFHLLPALLVGNDFDLVIAGQRDPRYEMMIMGQATRHGVAHRIRPVGAISEEDKYWYYKNCSAFAFPSIAEGFGLPVIEAMAFGKPTFLSKETSLPEVGGQQAFYFDDFDPERMRSVFNGGMSGFDSNRAEESRKWAAEFTWGKAAKEYWKIYREVAG